MESLLEAMKRVPDSRMRRGRRHPQSAMLTLAVVAMLAGARSVYAIAQWGRDHGQEVAAALGFTRPTTPSGATLHRLLRDVDRTAFEGTLAAWFQAQGDGGETVAVDGKTLRGSRQEGVAGVHLVAAYAHRRGVVLDQEGTGSKEGELTALRTLLERLPLAGRVLTGDAQFTQRDVCERVLKKGATTCSP